MQPPSMINIKEYMRDLLPSRLACCCRKNTCWGPNRVELAFSKARDKVALETNIIEIIKSRRYSCAALKLLLTKEQRDKLKEQTRYYAIDPESEEKPEQKQAKIIDNLSKKESKWTDGFYTSRLSESEEFDFEKNDEAIPPSEMKFCSGNITIKSSTLNQQVAFESNSREPDSVDEDMVLSEKEYHAADIWSQRT